MMFGTISCLAALGVLVAAAVLSVLDVVAVVMIMHHNRLIDCCLQISNCAEQRTAQDMQLWLLAAAGQPRQAA